MTNGKISGTPQPSSDHLHPTIDHSIMSHVNEETINSDHNMATMDEMAFNASLDALLANDDVVDSTDGSTDATEQTDSLICSSNSPPRFGSVSISAMMPPPPQQQQQQPPLQYNPVSMPAPLFQGDTKNILPGQRVGHRTTTKSASSDTPILPNGLAPFVPASVACTHGHTIAPSPLTARLNFPMTAVASVPQFPAIPQAPMSLPQGGLLHAGQSSARRIVPDLPPPGTTRRKRGRGGASSSFVPAHGPDIASAVSEDEGDGKKRRMGRNQREQQRSHQITQQISHLRDVLAAANVNFKPDKYSTLVSVVDYITQLQSRSMLLDAEHKRILDTIARTNEMVNSSYCKTNTNGDISLGSDLRSDAVPSGPVLEDEVGVYVQGLDYRAIFNHCGMALAVASIDGRFIDCNPGFERLTGYSREELLPSCSKKQEAVADSVPSCAESSGSDCGSSMTGDDSPRGEDLEPKRNLSLFNLLSRETMEKVFMAMSCMLKQPMLGPSETTDSEDSVSLRAKDFWNGLVSQSRQKEIKVCTPLTMLMARSLPSECISHMSFSVLKLRINVTLLRSPQGRPKFFNCSLTPMDD
jgi:PAS domain-containing protein